MLRLWLAVLCGAVVRVAKAQSTCPNYNTYAETQHAPLSSGTYALSYMRPVPGCRTFNSSAVEKTVKRLKGVIKDPDLYRLFQNSFPNTLDTVVEWRGYAANNSAEELAFIITGDIDAMWLRDSANQLKAYRSLLKPSTSFHSLASLFRGAINLQTRYLLTSPYCQSFQPPVESGIPPAINPAANNDRVNPPYSNTTVFECKWELDSFGAFLELSYDYYKATGDSAFFGQFQWVAAVQQILNVSQTQMISTYASNGLVNPPGYSFTRLTTTATDTLDNSGRGNPVNAGVGLIRSAFRPSDDATIYQFFIPANMMFSQTLQQAAAIMSALPGQSALAAQMTALAASLRTAIQANAVVQDPKYGAIYAYEIDGYGTQAFMDDANIPSLLSIPVLGFVNASNTVYQNTRKKVLSADNPYYMRGPVISAVGGPHDGPGRAWPMASIVQILTSSNQSEVVGVLKQLVSSTDGLGLIHESILTTNQSAYTRPWFSWANGLFGEMILDLETRMPAVLKMSFQ